jgi:tRNA threonylcarbamoyl adenosine modification protein YjeE
MTGSEAESWKVVVTQPELEAWGERIGREVGLPTVLALSGELGAGKSTLARAVARGAGVEGSVPSPTFNLLFAYETPRARVLHLDLYRLERPEEVWELGWEEFGQGRDLVLIEWPDRARELLPVPRWEVVLEEVADPARRAVRVEPVGRPAPLPPLPLEEGR